MLIPVIGLEVHIELNTKSKMFCGCANDAFGSEPNTRTCPTCLGLPGALPVPNKAAIESTILLGLALGCDINKESFFERKNYFYPDLPKGYQISQYQKPLCVGGRLGVIRINRIHQEEDTAKLIHEDDKTLIDFNRSGVPLTELVTEADFRDATTAKAFLKELTRIIRYLGVSEADMERGTMRLEANISLQEEGQFEVNEAKVLPLGDYHVNPKVEVKNINSFRFVEKAINFELARQKEILESGGQVVQETRGYNEKTGKTYSQREKEEAHDYRYFPEPDIPPLVFTSVDVDSIRSKLPELPRQKVARWVESGIKPADAEILAETMELADLFDDVSSEFVGRPLVGLRTDQEPATSSELRSPTRGDPTKVANLLVNKPEFQKNSVEEILEELKKVLDKKEVSSEELQGLVDEVIIANPKAVEDFKKGKEAGLKFLVGQVMRLSKGSADITKVEELVKSSL